MFIQRIINYIKKIIPQSIKSKIYNLLIEVILIPVIFQNLYFKSKIKDYKNIPIIINNRNHFTYLKKLINFLEKKEYNNIIILDNASTYQPLLDYYKKIKHRIIYLNENLGHMALNKCNLFNEIKNDYFVYTDPDILPIDECPDDFLKHFLDLMKKDYKVQKVGFSLKIDDLPDCYNKKQQVINWEKQFWNKKIKQDVYIASIDTTFALHRPNIKSSFLNKYTYHYRTDYPYQARHLPWYEDSNNLPEDILFYLENAVIGNHW